MPDKPKPKPKIEVRNPRYKGATSEMVVLASMRPVNNARQDDSKPDGDNTDQPTSPASPCPIEIIGCRSQIATRQRAHSTHPLLAELGDEDRTKTVPPEPDRLVAHLDPARAQKPSAGTARCPRRAMVDRGDSCEGNPF